MNRDSLLSLVKVDPSIQPYFLGDGMSLQRFDRPSSIKVMNLFVRQMDFFWRPERIDLNPDKADFHKLTESEQFIFVKNLQYQTLMDSVIARAIGVLQQHVSVPELEACFSWWQAFEVLHSYSYTHILKTVCPDTIRDIFDGVTKDPEITARAVTVVNDYDNLMRAAGDDQKDMILKALASTQVLEGIRFYLSFACSFSFAEPPNARMVGNATILKEICRDENVHVDITASVLNDLREQPKQGFQETWKRNQETIYEMFVKGSEEEKSWGSYLLSKGGSPGLSLASLHGYVEWLTDLRLKNIGLPAHYGRTENPIGPWMDKWLGAAQVAPQEVPIDSYRVGSFEDDITSFKGL